MTESEIAAFVDGRMAGEKRTTAMDHLAVCDECRFELAEVQQLLESAPDAQHLVDIAPQSTTVLHENVRALRALRGETVPTQQRFPRWQAIGAIASVAAVLAVVFVYPQAGDRSGTTNERERVAVIDRSTVVLIAPAAGDSLAPGTVRFVWHAEDDATYRITVTGSDGATLWSASTTDTIVVMPADKVPALGSTLHWFVDALRGDGQSMSSGSRNLHITTVR